MHKLSIYSVYDRTAQVFGSPFFFSGERADKLAQRAFAQAVEDKSSPIGKSPADYELHMIGTMDVTTGFVAGMADGVSVKLA